jgi:DNA-3-methyladenine glycosylase
VPTSFRPLSGRFFNRAADVVAPELLGAIIVSRIGRRVTSARIVETEAYLGAIDPASHGYRLRRHAQNEALYGRPGDWYVYLSYGIHWCANLVCGPRGHGGAVLLRAIEPLNGIPTMRSRRGSVRSQLLGNGPGKLCQALGITRRDLDGRAMAGSPVQVGRERRAEAPEVAIGLRIGITKAADWPLRFSIAGSPWLSRP